jgi:hypothetical protein
MNNDNYVYEAFVAAMERTIRRQWIALAVVFIAFVTVVAAWVIREQQFEVITQEVTQETEDDGINNFYGGDYYGETDN